MANKKYPAIEFKEFDFPSWEEFKARRTEYDGAVLKVRMSNSVLSIEEYIEGRLDVFGKGHFTFEHSEQGWELAKKQLNDWKYESYCEAGK